MASILGFDLNRAIDGIAGRFDQLVGPQPGNPFGAAAPGGANPFTAGALGGGNPFGAAAPGDRNPFGAIGPQAGNPFGTVGSGQGNPFGGAALGGNPFAPASMFPAAKPAPVTVGDGATTPGGGTGGLAPGVAKWADQTRQVFGDIPDLDPDTMLAIMTNESGGDPNTYNAAGDAWGLFQNVGLGSKDPQVQFQAAHQLAQQKMAALNASYAQHGLNPDARTRARDFALAWAGHFDYATGQPNPNSRDVGSGQTAAELTNIFLANYDRIKAAQQGGGGSVAGVKVTQAGYAFPVVGYQGHVQLHHGEDAGASDIMAPRGTPIVAMRGGKVIDASYNSLGGWSVSIQGEDGLTYYYAHMDQPPQVQAGQTVQTGTQLGVVGDSGNAQGTGTHLHLGIGHGIASGAGSHGGAGENYNAVDLLNTTQDQLSFGG